MTKVYRNHPKAIFCQFNGRNPLSFIVAKSRTGTHRSIKLSVGLTASIPAGYQNQLLSGHGSRR